MAYTYIIYSPSLNLYYVGETLDIESRLLAHNSGLFEGSFTSKASDWQLTLSLQCRDRSHARAIELHIKSMKSKTYLMNLIKYPELRQKLISRF